MFFSAAAWSGLLVPPHLVDSYWLIVWLFHLFCVTLVCSFGILKVCCHCLFLTSVLCIVLTFFIASFVLLLFPFGWLLLLSPFGGPCFSVLSVVDSLSAWSGSVAPAILGLVRCFSILVFVFSSCSRCYVH
mmetsp:Transcript_10620/g.14074  ORF Transcript_10620/g.14074 Transcript_10620/m.14074 type:complete len:131 (-) Transcript_10620:99-491(-)